MWLNFVLWCLIFVDPQHGTCYIPSFWRPDFCGGSQVSEKCLHPFRTIKVNVSVHDKAMWGLYSYILNHDIRQRRAVRFTSHPLHPWGMSPWYPLKRRLAGTENRTGQGGEKKRFLPSLGIEPIGHLARNLVTISNTLSRRHVPDYPVPSLFSDASLCSTCGSAFLCFPTHSHAWTTFGNSLPHWFWCPINTLRTGAFKLFKCTFPGSKQFKSTFILCFFKNL